MFLLFFYYYSSTYVNKTILYFSSIYFESTNRSAAYIESPWKWFSCSVLFTVISVNRYSLISSCHFDWGSYLITSPHTHLHRRSFEACIFLLKNLLSLYYVTMETDLIRGRGRRRNMAATWVYRFSRENREKAQDDTLPPVNSVISSGLINFHNNAEEVFKKCSQRLYLL